MPVRRELLPSHRFLFGGLFFRDSFRRASDSAFGVRGFLFSAAGTPPVPVCNSAAFAINLLLS